MRRIAFFAVFLFLTPVLVIAETGEEPTLGWATSGGGFDDDILSGNVILPDNSVVSVGSFITAANFGDEGIGANGMLGDADMFIAVSNETGNWTNIKSYGSPGVDGIDAIASIASEVNATVENIGARRLHTIIEKILEKK